MSVFVHNIHCKDEGIAIITPQRRSLRAFLLKCLLPGVVLLVAFNLFDRYVRPLTSTGIHQGNIITPHEPLPHDSMLDSSDSLMQAHDDSAFVTICDTLKKGESLYGVLLRHGVDRNSIQQLLCELRKIFNVERSLPGDVCMVISDLFNMVHYFEYVRDEKDIYVVEKHGDGFTSYSKQVDATRTVRAVQGEIRSSLYEAMRQCDVEPELIFDFTRIFAWDIDFYVDPRVGDTFRLLFEEARIGDKVVDYGRILAAEYVGEEGTRRVVLYEDSTGHSDYYTPEGKSIRKTFLKSPFKYGYTRISSGFSWNRLHPIRKIRRPHLGVDYAAPSGTPVISTSDGTVAYAGRKGGFGNYVEIRHGGSMTTTYGHLSRYGKGIRTGARVSQGQIVGYVGSTGLSTGPHLDYRVMQNGRFVNPLTMNIPTATPVKPEFLEDFQLTVQELTSALDLVLAVAASPLEDSMATEARTVSSTTP